jgi:hypothetical protein
MSDLKEDLDRALRSVTFGTAPVEQAKQHGRRIRARRRAALLAGALAVAAIAAGYPALTRTGAVPAPPAGNQTAAPQHTSYDGDPVVTAYPPATATQAPGGLTSKDGQIGGGTIGTAKWQATVLGPDRLRADTCYSVGISSSVTFALSCEAPTASLASGLNGNPAAFAAETGGNLEATFGAAAPDVTYFIVTFTDGQQLKLIPVTLHGTRYFTWIAPLSMTVKSVEAHLGSAYATNGQIMTAVPFEPPGQLPTFGLWQQPGQAAPPNASAIVGSGSTGGHVWAEIAYEGPFGTCFTPGSDSRDRYCLLSPRLGTTAVLGGWGGSPPETAAFGSAAPGVALVRVTLSNGTVATARPVGVGNEHLFAFAIGKNVSPVRWIAYDASGKQVGTGSMTTGSATGTITLSP